MELKAYDNEVYNSALSANTLSSANYEPSTTQALNLITQGDAIDQLVGRKYFLRHISMRGRVAYTPAASNATQPVVRLVLYVDRMTNGNGTTGNSGGKANGLFATPTNAQNTVYTYRYLNYGDRFDVLVDRTVVLRPAANIAATEQADYTHIFDFQCPLEKYCYECIVPDGTVVPTNYSIRFAVLTDSSSCVLDYCYRVRFSG
jgi:hypothetical protein